MDSWSNYRSVTSEYINEIRLLRRGDQIATEGKIGDFVYFHHGIFLGHEIGVADFGGNRKNDEKIRICDIMAFIEYGKKRLIRIVYPPKTCLSPDKTVEEAEKFVQEPNKWKPFSILFNNCEHFATKCKTGVAYSKQAWENLMICLTNPAEALAPRIAASSLYLVDQACNK